MDKRLNLVGQKFNNLLAVKLLPKDSTPYGKHLCRCDCGGLVVKYTAQLRNGVAKSCGCARGVDLTGKRFGRLVVLKRIPSNGSGKRYHLCRCDCGNIKKILSTSLRKGTKSCGCLLKDILSDCKTTHGLSYHPLYATWHTMIRRCYDESFKCYRWYGERGIRVCDEWKNSLEVFIDWMEHNGWKKGLELDRIDPDRDYNTQNCRLLTKSENSKRARPKGSVTKCNNGRNYLQK